jgi:hypothetical protein
MIRSQICETTRQGCCNAILSLLGGKTKLNLFRNSVEENPSVYQIQPRTVPQILQREKRYLLLLLLGFRTEHPLDRAKPLALLPHGSSARNSDLPAAQIYIYQTQSTRRGELTGAHTERTQLYKKNLSAKASGEATRMVSAACARNLQCNHGRRASRRSKRFLAGVVLCFGLAVVWEREREEQEAGVCVSVCVHYLGACCEWRRVFRGKGGGGFGPQLMRI